MRIILIADVYVLRIEQKKTKGTRTNECEGKKERERPDTSSSSLSI